MAVYEYIKKIIGEEKSEKLRDFYWTIPLPAKQKEDLYYFLRGRFKSGARAKKSNRNSVLKRYISDLLAQQEYNNSFSIDYPSKSLITLQDGDPKLIAFYLPQYYPDPHNTKWWGRGSTEWTNVSKSMPQYLGHYQPRFPGELGFYDLRIMENIYRQIELAKFYGIYGFCFYFYWFDGVRLLDLPLNNFVYDTNINFPFSICWVNESWTRQWESSSNIPLIIQNPSVESYKNFIKSCTDILKRPNYIKVYGKPVLHIYKPGHIPERKKVIKYWRNL